MKKKIILVEGLSYSECMREQQILWFTHVCTEQLNPSSPFISTVYKLPIIVYILCIIRNPDDVNQ